MSADVPIHVVLIDPSARGRSPEMAALRAAGMDVRLVTDASVGPPVGPADVVVADLRSSDGRPFAVLRLAFDLERPVVVITHIDQVDARLAALRHGSADHLVAPTQPRELVERVRHAAAPSPVALAPPLAVDAGARQVRRDGRAVTVTPSELAILEALVARGGALVTKAQLAEALPGRPRPNTVEAHVSGLRRKLASIGAPPIKTVHRQGYLLQLTLPAGRPVLRTADLLLQRERVLHQRSEHVRRRDEIVRRSQLRHVRGGAERPPPVSG